LHLLIEILFSQRGAWHTGIPKLETKSYQVGGQAEPVALVAFKLFKAPEHRADSGEFGIHADSSGLHHG
jgi:hypothetical protein